MARSATAFLPSAPMVYAVISDPGIVDNPDIPSYQPHVYGRCDPPALIPLQMNARNVHNPVNQPEWRSPGTDTGLEGLFLSSFRSVREVRSLSSTNLYIRNGIGDACKHSGIRNFIKELSKWSGSPGYCLEIGNGSWDSWTKPLLKQTSIACEKVKKMSDLGQGYNIVGLSQGNLIGRGIIEFCDGAPPVKNFISLGGPHAGTASIPLCGSESLCTLIDVVLQLGIYSRFAQVSTSIFHSFYCIQIIIMVFRKMDVCMSYVHFLNIFLFNLLNRWLTSLISLSNTLLQQNLAPSGYVKIPICSFVASVNGKEGSCGLK
ncbi:uncharacterized protein [Glycine max]|uniref:uncharacterized protein n=1 Tax=Glycine max TaxID=3847 RepID=UPI001B356614|nr:uncharacterized protein LOC102659903 [Glycine max]